MDLSAFHSLDVVLVCGLPGSGKSHFAAEHFRDTGRNRVNRKELHRLLFEMIHFGGEWTEAQFDAIDDFLVKHVERKRYVTIAQQMPKSIGVIFLHTPAATCMERNLARPDPVPERVIPNLAAAIDLPRAEEGFRGILVLKGG